MYWLKKGTILRLTPSLNMPLSGKLDSTGGERGESRKTISASTSTHLSGGISGMSAVWMGFEMERIR
jgi:hypothetical protein